MPSLPTAFLSHGLPQTTAFEEPWAEALRAWARDLKPRAILVASSRWRTDRPTFTASRRPGISREFPADTSLLDAMPYDPPGHPGLVLNAISLLSDADMKGDIDTRRALDHGAWLPARTLFPKGDIPIVEMSLPHHVRPEDHARLGLLLSPLREQGVLILGSGCLAHGPSQSGGGPEPWAVAFDRWLEERLRLGEMAASFSAPPHLGSPRFLLPDPLAPLFFAWGAADGGAARSIFEGWQEGAVSLRSVTFAA